MSEIFSKAALKKLKAPKPASEPPVTADVSTQVLEMAANPTSVTPTPTAEVLLGEPPAQELVTLRDRAATLNDARRSALELSRVDASTKAEFVREIHVLWEGTKQRFLLIGEYLITARATLPHGEYEQMVNDELPFGASIARQLRAVAQAVRSQVIPVDALPSSYATAYQLTTLEAEELEAAKSQGLVRPDVKRHEIVDFKKRWRSRRTITVPTGEAPLPPAPPQAQSPADLLDDLLEEERQLKERLRDVRERIAALRAKSPTE